MLSATGNGRPDMGVMHDAVLKTTKRVTRNYMFLFAKTVLADSIRVVVIVSSAKVEIYRSFRSYTFLTKLMLTALSLKTLRIKARRALASYIKVKRERIRKVKLLKGSKARVITNRVNLQALDLALAYQWHIIYYMSLWRTYKAGLKRRVTQPFSFFSISSFHELSPFSTCS